LDEARLEGFHIVGTAPPERYRGLVADVNLVPLLVELFGPLIEFFNRFPGRVSTNVKDYTIKDVDEAVDLELDLQKKLRDARVVGMLGASSVICGRPIALADKSMFENAGDLVLDNGFGVMRLYYWMADTGFDAHHASAALRAALLPQLRQLDVLALSFLTMEAKKRPLEAVHTGYASSELRWYVQKTGEAIKAEWGPRMTVESDLSLVERVYDAMGNASPSSSNEPETNKPFIAALRATNGMKAVNRAMFYCLRLEPAFQRMNQASKANVYIRAKTASSYAGSLSFVTQDVNSLTGSTGLGLLELAKKAYYLTLSVPGGDSDEKRARIIHLLSNPDELQAFSAAKGKDFRGDMTDSEFSDAQSKKGLKSRTTALSAVVRPIVEQAVKEHGKDATLDLKTLEELESMFPDKTVTQIRASFRGIRVNVVRALERTRNTETAAKKE